MHHKLIFIFCTVFFLLSENKRETKSKNIFFIFTFNTKTFEICNQHINHTEKSVEISPFRICSHKFQPCVKLNHLFKCYKIKWSIFYLHNIYQRKSLVQYIPVIFTCNVSINEERSVNTCSWQPHPDIYFWAWMIFYHTQMSSEKEF